MDKIYQKMYLKGKKKSKGVLGGFIDNVILRGSYSGSQLFENIKQLGCRVKASRHDANINNENINDDTINNVILRGFYSESRPFGNLKWLGCRVKASRHDDNIRGYRVKASRHDDHINNENINDDTINNVILRGFYSESRPFGNLKWLGCRVKASRHDANINNENINDDTINNVILRSFNSESQPFSIKRAGFTLIELLVVVLILGILAAIALPQYQVAILKSRFMSFMPTVRALINAQEVYYMANGRYAYNLSQLDVQIPADCRARSNTSAPNEILCGTDWLLDNVSSRMEPLGVMSVSYCPGNNTNGSTSCVPVSEVSLTFYYSQHAEKPDQVSCSAKTKKGTLLCHTLKGIF